MKKLEGIYFEIGKEKKKKEKSKKKREKKRKKKTKKKKKKKIEREKRKERKSLSVNSDFTKSPRGPGASPFFFYRTSLYGELTPRRTPSLSPRRLYTICRD